MELTIRVDVEVYAAWNLNDVCNELSDRLTGDVKPIRVSVESIKEERPPLDLPNPGDIYVRDGKLREVLSADDKEVRWRVPSNHHDFGTPTYSWTEWMRGAREVPKV